MYVGEIPYCGDTADATNDGFPTEADPFDPLVDGNFGPDPFDAPDDEDADPQSECEKTDRSADTVAALISPSIWAKCEATGNEWGAAIYRDGQGRITVTEPFTGTIENPGGDPIALNPSTGLENSGIDQLSVIGFIHCHPTGIEGQSADDRAFLFAFGYFLQSNGGDHSSFRNYILSQKQQDNGRSPRKFKYRPLSCPSQE